MRSNLRLIGFETPDKLSLPGLLYEPGEKTDRVALYLHGNGSSSVFYGTEEMNTLGKYLVGVGISFFPFNEYINNLKLSKKPLFKEYKTINKPTLVVYGELDEYCYGNVPRCVDILKKECPNPKLFTFKIIKNADHGFDGKEKELAEIIAKWLKS